VCVAESQIKDDVVISANDTCDFVGFPRLHDLIPMEAPKKFPPTGEYEKVEVVILEYGRENVKKWQ